MIERIRSAIGERLSRARYFLADLFYLLSRPFRSIGTAAGDVLGSISPENRWRLAAGTGAVALIAIVALLVVPNLPCSFPGGDACAPDDDAIEVVPADALAYVHVSLDTDNEQYEDVVGIANRTPLVTKQVLVQMLPIFLGASGRPPNFEEEIDPWFGGEIAIAVVPGGAGTQQVQMLEVSDTDGAREYEESIAAGNPEPEDYQGIDIREDERGLASAIVEDFLVLGTASGVRSVIDVSAGAEGADSLADDATASEAFDALPAERFAEAYLSTEGIDSFLALSDGALAPVEPLVDSGDSLGAAFAVSADEGGLRLATRSLLDPERDPEGGGFFSAFDPFEPVLPAEIAPDTLAYAGFGNADETLSSLLEQATVRAPGVAKGFTDLVERLRRDVGVDISEELLPALNGEGAIAVAPRPAEEEIEASAPDEDEVPEELQSPDGPETIARGGSEPYLQFLADDVDAEATGDALARLQEELAKSVDPSIANPVFREEQFGDVTGQVLERGPGNVIAYGIADGKLAIANDTAAVERLDGDPDSGLGGAEIYTSATEELAEEPLMIAFFDLAGLITLAEQLGAGAESPFTTFAEDLRRLQTLALTVSREEDTLATDSYLRIATP